MERYTAAYSYTNYNFVIQNIEGKNSTKNKFYSLICVLKNILQRGCPTTMSSYLTDKLGTIDLKEMKYIGLIDDEVPRWINTIKGDSKNNNYPAKVFFEELIPLYFGEYAFIQKLIKPEVDIKDIVGKEDEQFIYQKVDFYLQRFKLVIEIDGGHHNDTVQKYQDSERDEYLKENGIKTIRISTEQIYSKDNSFLEKVNEIINHISQYKNSLKIYQNVKSFDEYDDEELRILKACAVIRIQITLLSLLQKGKINLDDKVWKINILQRDVNDFLDLAIEDLFVWFENLCVLNNMDFNRPKLDIIECKTVEDFIYYKDYINIDFSINKRYTDENEINTNILYVRTDYFDKVNYFKVSTTEDPICYKIDKENKRCTEAMEYLLKSIFGYEKFRDGQLPIIMNSLQGEDTVGILPTGSGKSICYQLVALLQPCISFVVCPIKSLIYDQETNLKKVYINNVASITGDKDGEEKAEIIKSFSNEKYQFIFISPERFQSKVFRQSLNDLNIYSTVGLAVIDEVHCLSEWGHDFRTSYLNLVKTIRNYTPSARLLGLTATASNFVLNDIKKEFKIESYNIKTLTSFTREELNFKVIRCDENDKQKKKILFDTLKDMNDNNGIFELKGDETNTGIIFTPNVNGDRGCYQLSQDINKKFNINSNFYSGKAPNKNYSLNTDTKKFAKHKKEVQEDFKNNKIPLLVATKAFGMGIDKQNVRYTIHFGIPASLESLYQEAGRAGRDKKEADCFVLYEPEIVDESIIDKFFSLDTPVEELKDIQKNLNYNEQKDVLNNFFLWLNNNKGIEYECDLIKFIYDKYSSPGDTKKVKCKDLGHNLSDVQKAIYRLSVMGVVSDWTVEVWDSNKGVLEVIFEDFDIDKIRESIGKYIYKYNAEFDYTSLSSTNRPEDNKTISQMREILEDKNLNEIEKQIRALLIWIYDNIVYTRRQSIKSISDECKKFTDGQSFKKVIENYFKFDDDTYLLDYIAENPAEYDKWFEIFIPKDKISMKEHIENTKGTLRRFLESYRYNTGLNFISGIVHLMTDEFNNVDGKQRLESAFNQIKQYDNHTRNEILEFCLEMGNNLSLENKLNLSKVLCGNYEDKLKIHESLKDDHSLKLIIEETSHRLRGINGRIQCQKQEN